MRGSYSGNTLAFQANAESSILLPRSNICVLNSVGRVLPLHGSCRRFEPVRTYQFIRSVAQSGSAPGLGPGGPRFESLYSDQF